MSRKSTSSVTILPSYSHLKCDSSYQAEEIDYYQTRLFFFLKCTENANDITMALTVLIMYKLNDTTVTHD